MSGEFSIVRCAFGIVVFACRKTDTMDLQRSDKTFISRVGYCVMRTYVVTLGATMSQISGLARTSFATTSSLFPFRTACKTLN
jgi:hypothetical protein